MSDEMIRLNEERIRRLTDLVIFDDTDRIYRAPTWSRIQQELRDIPLRLSTACAGVESTVPEPVEHGLAAVLSFPPGRPVHRRHFDLVRFRLGFPGVSLRIRDGEWSFAVDTSECGIPVTSANTGTVIELDGLEGLMAACTYDNEGRITAYPDVG